MQQKISLRLLPAEAADESAVKRFIANSTGNKLAAVTGFHIIKKSIDARSKVIWTNLTVNAFIDEPFHHRETRHKTYPDVANSQRSAVIIGAGPAGLFAALKCIELGIKPVILERGKDVRSRRRDLARLNKEGIVNPESNYCFGEGGAGTYSDGKLYTRSNKRGDIDSILHCFVRFGADENILYESHPHIGTNKLPDIITAMRLQINDCGGQLLFGKKMSAINIEKNSIRSVTTEDGNTFEADAFILATGHSARDIFILLHQNNIRIEAKPFALGVRVEHPQQLIDNIQYHCPLRDAFLPPASYSLVQQVNNRGVFSFCMCPGGIIAPAATSPGEIVVNGWSPSKRNNPFANSGMVVQVEEADAFQYLKKRLAVNGNDNVEGIQQVSQLENNPLLLLYFQQMVERECFNAGGGSMVAPAQRMVDFSHRKISSTLPACSYLPGLHSSSLQDILPDFIFHSLAKGFVQFGKKMPGRIHGESGYFTNEAIVVATESRTSSPVRIPRNPITLTHPQLDNFYPCGEGAGYAGGIVSAAMDGERVATQMAGMLQ